MGGRIIFYYINKDIQFLKISNLVIVMQIDSLFKKHKIDTAPPLFKHSIYYVLGADSG